jgi:hypothetical protein
MCTLAGFGFGLAFLTGFSIGLLILPFAIVAGFLAAWRATGPDDALGLVLGAGAVCLLIAYIHRDDVTGCVRDGNVVECGGMNPQPWAVIGGALVIASLLAYAFLCGGRRSFFSHQ